MTIYIGQDRHHGLAVPALAADRGRGARHVLRRRCGQPASTPTSRRTRAGRSARTASRPARAAVRQAAAEARAVLLGLAAKQLGVPVSQLTVDKGVVSVKGDSSKSVTYGALLGGKRFSAPNTGRAPLKAVADVQGRRQAAAPATTRPRRSPAPTRTSTTSACRGCCTAGSSARAARARTPSRCARSASTRARSRTSRASRVVRKGDFIGVVGADRAGRDPGRGAAEGQVVRVGDDARERQPLEDASGETARTLGERYAADSGNIDDAASPGGARAGGRATRSATSRTPRSGRRPGSRT